jgi:hypothetical protein
LAKIEIRPPRKDSCPSLLEGRAVQYRVLLLIAALAVVGLTDAVTAGEPSGSAFGRYSIVADSNTGFVWFDGIEMPMIYHGTTLFDVAVDDPPVRNLTVTAMGRLPVRLNSPPWPSANATVVLIVNLTPVATIPGQTGPPVDLDGDLLCDDLNSNGWDDFGDVILFFAELGWIGENEPLAGFDFNHNGRIDFGDGVGRFGLA